MMANRYDRAALALGFGALASSLFALEPGSGGKADFVEIRGAGLVVILLLGACAVVGGVVGNRVLVIISGAGFAVAAAIQLVQFGRPTNWLAGDGSTFALLLGLAVGLVAVGTARWEQSSQERERTSEGGPDRAT
jgi:hypothetical protein